MKNNFLIKKADIKDFNDIIRLNTELFKNEYRRFDKTLNLKWTRSKSGKNYFKEQITKKDSLCLVIESKKRIVGYLCGGLSIRAFYREKARCAELENMFVDKRFRNKGLGVKLVHRFINWCKQKNVNYISVTASVKNKQASKFYINLGFKDYDLILERRIK